MGQRMANDYFPILKAKQGELGALQSWDANRYPNMNPVVEVVPWERDEDSPDDIDQIEKAVSRIAKAWHGKSPSLLLDAASAEIDPENGWGAEQRAPILARVTDGLRMSGVNVAPVIRVTADETYAQRVGGILAAGGQLRRAAIRITNEDLDDTVTPLRDMALRTARNLGVMPHMADLILDFGPLSDDGAAAMAARLARFVLPQLADSGWRTLVLASGAFPVNLTGVSPFVVARMPRHDLDLWRNLKTLKLNCSLEFGDYAVTHPITPVGVPFAAAPQLRYTLGDEWLVIKGRRQDRRGHQQFFDICHEMLMQAGPKAPGPDASWGDSRIHLAAAQATGNADATGPGNASTWRSIGTSHHLAYVSSRLAEAGAP